MDWIAPRLLEAFPDIPLLLHAISRTLYFCSPLPCAARVSGVSLLRHLSQRIYVHPGPVRRWKPHSAFEPGTLNIKLHPANWPNT